MQLNYSDFTCDITDSWIHVNHLQVKCLSSFSVIALTGKLLKLTRTFVHQVYLFPIKRAQVVITKVTDFGIKRFYCTLSILGKIEGSIVHN